MEISEQENFATPTLFSVYEPIESYLDALQAARGGPSGDRAASSLGAIDFFLLHQWIAQYAMRPRVIDLASEATLGASTLFFLGNPQVREVLLLPPAQRAAGTPDWRPLLEAAVADRRVSPQAPCSFLAASRVGEIRRCFRENELRPPLLVLLHVDEKESCEALQDTLPELLSLQQDVVVAVCPVGRIGRCGVLASLIAHCASHEEHRLAAFRDVSPFTATSRLGILYRASNADADQALERLGHWFEGNFQFLSLTRELMGRHLAAESLQAKLDHIGELQQSLVWQAFQQVQQARQRFLPPGSRREWLVRAIWRAGRRAKTTLHSAASRFRKAA